MTTGTRWVCQYASARRSPPALDAEYGLDGRSGSLSRAEPMKPAPRVTTSFTAIPSSSAGFGADQNRSDARRQGVTTETYAVVRRREERRANDADGRFSSA